MTFCGKGQHIRAPAVRDTEGFVGVAVGDWQGGLSAATGAGYRKRASKEADGWLIFLPQAKNKSEQSGLCSDVRSVDKKDTLKSKKEVFSLSCQRLLSDQHNRNFLSYISNEIGRWSE